MTGASGLPDQAERRRALDPSRSFIVQAPAGSGKTELLIQRYLRLLACVDQPEEVLAVTFTRKAASEMRRRVIEAFTMAEHGFPPAEAHRQVSFELAHALLQDKRRSEWQIHTHAARFSIGTIDSVNAWLAGRTPLGEGSTALSPVTRVPEPLYLEAARATLGLLGDGDAASEQIACLLRHLDNDTARFERLIAAMLPRRDQWLRQLLGTHVDRASLEEPLRQLTENDLRRAAAAIEPELARELTELLSSAGAELVANNSDAPVVLWAGRLAFPAPEAEHLPLWQDLAKILLTEEGNWRKKVTATEGFPPQAPAKQRMQDLLERCAKREDLKALLAEIRILPGSEFQEQQWQILQALRDVLLIAAAELKLVFAVRAEVDFPEVAADALAALGGQDEPSELGLVLDHRISHVLVDEFQDTSRLQFDLLERLTAGWEAGDGRTLFLVGDPMQSIYRFRQAEVELFMQVRDQGIGSIRPEFLQLRVNFRSDPLLVDWINEVFGQTFPGEDDRILGAVRFTESHAALPGRPGAESFVHWLPTGAADEEARQVCDIVARCREEWPQEDVCILVRSRGHADAIIERLRQTRTEFLAPDLENLEHSGVAQDLLALTRAICHPADRLAWIALLRAPWCGFSLADLHALLAPDLKRPAGELLRDSATRARLSADGIAVLGRVLPVLARAAAMRGRRSLRDLIEGAWLALGGPTTLREMKDLETADTFLQLLETVEAGGDCEDLVWLGEQLTKRKGSLGSGNAGVQIMTVHKAKGLEFDTVILPGLGKVPRGDEPLPLAWLNAPTDDGSSAPVLAPMGPSGADPDPLYRYLIEINQRQQAHELDRLLYVACTRARKRLHLFAELQTKVDKGGDTAVNSPKRGSLLRRLWPALAVEATASAAYLEPADLGRRIREPVLVQPLIRRLHPDWRVPEPPPAYSAPGTAAATAAPVAPLEYDWATRWAMHAGSVVHYWLRVVAEQGAENFASNDILRLQPVFRRMLEQLGTDAGDLDRATDRVARALFATIADERGRWILSSEHRDAENELPVTLYDRESVRRLAVDRTFVSGDGCRWIIDYKTSAHEGGDLAAFLRLESERHREQLRNYRDALALMGHEPIRTALYFPLLSAFQEVNVDA